MPKYSFDSAKAALMATPPGRERNMYAVVRDILLNTLGHEAAQVLIDSQSELGEGIPDLILRAPLDEATLIDWAVFEVKDEPGIFRAPATREAVFMEKIKYVRLFTEWFVMIDPEVLVARPVAMRSQWTFDPAADIVLAWADTDETEFCRRLACLAAANAGVSASLREFRAGDLSKIACVKLEQAGVLTAAQQQRLRLAQSDFFASITRATTLLQQACINALSAQSGEIARLTEQAEAFGKDWGGYELNFAPFRLSGKKVQGPENARRHDREVVRLKRDWLRRPALAKLALRWLPAFHERLGSRQKDHYFAIETANLILARILLIRFFEDHGFFVDQNQKTYYVCNGGVAALQDFMRHYHKGYEQLLRLAYEKAHEIYAAVFDEMDLDWVLGVVNNPLSRALEVAMMLLSRFDFTTVRGDILSGIYDRFLDAKKRKEMGEYYTPPSIARYMVRRLNPQAGEAICDPACGSGTFLLEAWEHLIGQAVDDGSVTVDEMSAVLEKLAGCDLNPFSATLAQVQMLWHLLRFKRQFMNDGFPEIRIIDRQNSLRGNSVADHGALFAEINQPIHAYVIGNPPYVRPERNTQPLGKQDAAFYNAIGGADKNLFGLFIYKALTGLCRAPTDGVEAGILAFVVPLSFCDNQDNARLRELFRIGGRFRLIEIVDLEVIAPYVFDAAVNPILLIAQNRPATPDDRVILRCAGLDCVVDAKARLFDLERASRHEFAYADVWNADGAILTRATPAFLPILRHLAALPKLESVAQTFWVAKHGAKIEAWQREPPDTLDELLNTTPDGRRWEQQDMIRRGCVFRNKKPLACDPARAFDFYKGENVSVGRVEGLAVESGIDIDAIDDNALWRFRDLLPTRGFACLQITLGLTCAPFDPRKLAFLDTVTVFFPRTELQDFPFDLLLASRIYQFYFALCARRGAVSALWSHLYPANLRQLPWSDGLAAQGPAIEALRPEFERLCRAASSRQEALLAALHAQPTVVWRDAVRAAGARLDWSEALLEGEAVSIPAHVTVQAEGKHWRVSLGEDLFPAWVSVSAEEIACQLAAVLPIYAGEPLKREQLLKLTVPATAKACAAFAGDLAEYAAGGAQTELEAWFDRLDCIVGQALGLSEAQIDAIQHALRTDDFLRHIRPNLPFVARNRRGLSTALASSARYSFAEA